jgi:hypothetical protein
METATPYDASLTPRLSDELELLRREEERSVDGVRRAIERVESRLRELPGGREVARWLAGLRPSEPAAGRPDPSVTTGAHPASVPLRQLHGLSRQLDAVDHPGRGLAVGDHAARSAQELAGIVGHVLGALDPAEEVAKVLHRVLGYVSEVVRNALVRVRQFGEYLGVSSVAIGLATLPPELTVTFTFSRDGGGADGAPRADDSRSPERPPIASPRGSPA